MFGPKNEEMLTPGSVTPITVVDVAVETTSVVVVEGSSIVVVVVRSRTSGAVLVRISVVVVVVTIVLVPLMNECVDVAVTTLAERIVVVELVVAVVVGREVI